MTGAKRPALVGVLLALAVVTAAGVIVARGAGTDHGGGGGAGSPTRRPANTAPVVRRTLVATAVATGELGYGSATPVTVKATGTVTWLPAEGTVISRGQALLRVDDRPVVLLYGAIPMYRDVGNAVTTGTGATGQSATATTSSSRPPASGTSAPTSGTSASGATGTAAAGGVTPPAATAIRGRDVHQLESNLRALGYSGFDVDDTFSAQTSAAVRRWQRDLGLAVTGTVGAGDVVFLPGPIRIAHDLARVGSAAGGEPLSFTATVKVVVVNVPVRDAAWAVRGAGVTLTLPSGRRIAAAVTAVGTQASVQDSNGGSAGSAGSGGDGTGSDTQNATVPVTVAIADQAALSGLEGAPVDVGHILRERRDVLTVPVSALLALAGGGYGVQVVEPDRTRIVAVGTGMFADGAVEITGQVSAGQLVGLPG